MTSTMLLSPRSQSSFQLLEDIIDVSKLDFTPATSTSSPSSSSSPGWSGLPPTPPTPTYQQLDLDQQMAEALYSSTFNKQIPLQGAPTSFADLFSSFPSTSTLNNGNPGDHMMMNTYGSLFPDTLSPSETQLNLFPGSTFGGAIDPQLMASPSITADNRARRPSASPRQMSEENEDGEEEEEDDGEEDEDDEDGEDATPPPVATSTRSSAKQHRKPTQLLSASGVVKRSSATPTLNLTLPQKLRELNKDREEEKDDDWRPSPEEYKKLSSKEKRQLRNKISARNFRVRRKEYISTLESHIADRDRLIEVIRAELGASKNENVELRREVDTLKKALLEGRTSIEKLELPPPKRILQDSTSSANVRKGANTAGKLNKANTRKDVSTRSGGGAFWGGASVGSMGLGSGVTPVHATLIPDVFPAIASTLAGKPAERRMLENINPLLNTTLPSPSPSPSPSPGPSTPPMSPGGFDAFADANPFTLKTLDAYRMQLWGKMAREQFHSRAAQNPQQQQASQQTHQPQPAQQTQASIAEAYANHLASSMKPAFFGPAQSVTPPLSPKTPASPLPSLSRLLSGKPSTSSYIAPTPSTSTLNAQAQAQAQAASYMAALASQTLLSRMGTAFWDAFSGKATSSSGSSGLNKEWDVEKVRKVLEGTAVVRVVDVDSLEDSMSRMSLGSGEQVKKEEPWDCSASSLLKALRK